MSDDKKSEQSTDNSKHYVFFHVCGQVTYSKGEDFPQRKQEFVTMLWRGDDVGITLKEYGSIHMGLVKKFEEEYGKALKIEKCDVVTILPLGLFTMGRFQGDVALNELNQDPDKKS